MLPEAMALAGEDIHPSLVAIVVDAVLDREPDWVFRTCARQFDRIVEAGKSPQYDEAVDWLRKARETLATAGRKDEWTAYLDGLIERHRRKRTLTPRLEELRI